MAISKIYENFIECPKPTLLKEASSGPAMPGAPMHVDATVSNG